MDNTIRRCALTTYDNPYNPFTEFSEWFLFDVEQGYNTCEYLARFTMVADYMSDSEIEATNESVIDDIIKNDCRGIYKKVFDNE